jgi:HEAT repeat protein
VDEQIRFLERQLKGDPVNRALLRELGQLYDRTGRPFFGQSISDWIKQLSHKDWKQALLAAVALKNIGPLATNACADIIDLLERRLELWAKAEVFLSGDEYMHVGTALIEALQSLDGRSSKGLEVLIEIVDQEYDCAEAARVAAANAIAAWGSHARAAIPALLRALESYDWELQKVAAEALAEIGPLAKDVIPTLINVLGDEDDDVVQAVVRALGRFSSDHKEALDALLNHLSEDADWEAQCAIIQVLGELGPDGKQAVPTLTRQLEDFDVDVQKAAAQALILIGESSKVAIPLLSERLNDGEEDTWRVMADAILKIQSCHD